MHARRAGVQLFRLAGMDRNSPLLAHDFDERDPGFKRRIESVVKIAHEHGPPVGICARAPSDHPECAEWLAERGIHSFSLTPDSLPAARRRLAAATGEEAGGARIDRPGSPAAGRPDRT